MTSSQRRQFGRYLKAILEEGMATGRLRLVEKQATSADARRTTAGP